MYPLHCSGENTKHRGLSEMNFMSTCNRSTGGLGG